ncbi:MAG: prolyl oligopeptidase family serine peptidase, partial [bacterium]|nr:prolyl oligopeptidase family serine peptidase [bacterium]
DEELIKKFSNEKQVTAETPPTFLWHTSEDTGVPPQNSIVFYEQLKKHKVPAEMHIFAKGRHGTGLAKSVPGANMWPALMEEWMKTRGLLGGVVSN